nr:cation transporter [Ornithinimicrobium flavum]
MAGQRLSQRPATARETYRWSRGEILGALFNGLFLVLMAGYLLWMGAVRLFEPVELPTSVLLSVAVRWSRDRRVRSEAALTALSDTNGVEDLHHGQARSPTSGRTVFSAHLRGDRGCGHSPGAAGGATHQFTGPRRDFSILQVEQECLYEHGSADTPTSP